MQTYFFKTFTDIILKQANKIIIVTCLEFGFLAFVLEKLYLQ